MKIRKYENIKNIAEILGFAVDALKNCMRFE